MITTALCVSATLLLESVEQQIEFGATLLCICVVSPTMKWWLQQYKIIVVGPWDIAHIVVDDDNTNQDVTVEGTALCKGKKDM